MKIKSVGITNQTNFKEQNVAFQGYISKIKKDELKKVIALSNDEWSYGMSKRNIQSLTDKAWKSLKSIQKAYKKDKAVDVNTFMEGTHIWAMVKTSDAVRAQLPLSGAGRGDFLPIGEFLISGLPTLKSSVDKHAVKLRQEYQHLVR